MLRDKREAVPPPLCTLAAYATEFFLLVGENSIPYFFLFSPKGKEHPCSPERVAVAV
jgi:hypothetical protein